MTAARRVLPTLSHTAHPLAPAEAQRRVLSSLGVASFDATVAAAGQPPLRAGAPQILQINLGKRCNQTCHHCHVDAGPDRREVMTDAVVDACLALLEASSIPLLDVTGGAPELHPRFREIVLRARALGARVIDRCNLTITRLPSYADLPAFFAENGVEIVASLPWYAPKQTDAQRGDGVFQESIDALRTLNALGYGVPGTGLLLDLVTNPAGAFLPPKQASLEREYKREMQRRWGVTFNRLFTITNMPVSRFLEYLQRSGNLEAYMDRLVSSFNPAAVSGVMCRSTLSVGWDGQLYDCDFNQMLDLPLGPTVFDASATAAAGAVDGRAVRTGPHCFGCTAGGGSSCGGSTAG
jgi:radical SAM/Cys-rich protein